MTRRQKIGILLVAILAIIILLIIWLWRNRPVEVAPIAVVPVVEEETPVLEPQPTSEAVAEQEVRSQSASVQSLAKIFTERYGSFSTEANFANLEDVLSLMTDDLAAATQNYIDTAASSESFYGVTTRVVSVFVEELDEDVGRARVIVTAQRQEAKDSPQNVTVKYQDLELSFEKVSGTWKVSSAEWL